MAKDDLRYVGHMIDSARQIEQFLSDKTRSQFDADEVLRLAVVHLIQTLGEAARLVSEDFRFQHPEVPWPKIVGMRNRIVHDYLNVDYDIAWQVARVDLPDLIDLLSPLIPASP